MNKSSKIILLVIAIIVAIGGVMAFYKTIVSPPGKLDLKNQYVYSIRNDISKIKDVKSDYSIDSVYIAVAHEILFMWKDSLISNKENDELLESFLKAYVPVYVDNCNSKFQQSYWNEEQLKKMQDRIKELHSISNSEGTIMIDGELNNSLNDIYNIVVNYYAAKSASMVGGYNGLQSAKQRIASSKKFACMSPINNCTDLVCRLNGVAKKLEHAHYAYLNSEIERLRSYQNYTQEGYDNLALSISDKIDEYKKNAKTVYGTISNVSVLEQKAGHYYSNAQFD